MYVHIYVCTYMHACQFVESSSLASDTQSAECRYEQCNPSAAKETDYPAVQAGGEGEKEGEMEGGRKRHASRQAISLQADNLW